jgi:hypothetical protein
MTASLLVLLMLVVVLTHSNAGVMIGEVPLIANQQPTLAQRVEQANGSIELVVIADGTAVTLSQMIASTDLIVRGVVGEGVAQFTPDGQSITTTYIITNPTILFSAMPPVVTAPGVVPRPLTITMPGGTVAVGQFFATVHYAEVTEVKRGMGVIALLQDRGGKYTPAAGAGVFEVNQGRVATLFARRGGHHEFSGMTADEFVSQIVTMRKNLPKR